ncbi:hypothetical protein VTN49DRAFT_5278 [Thermomyces lanuginosus]|uniref:uncharacterized protein n=1 Tax=Thermomyces lanuginosus TaxID=5541 RepID=UPI003742321A
MNTATAFPFLLQEMPRDKISADELFDILRKRKGQFEECPFLLHGNLSGPRMAYYIIESSPNDWTGGKHRIFTLRKARMFFEVLRRISETLFILVAASISLSHIAELKVTNILRQIERWWESYKPSGDFELQAKEVMCRLDDEWKKGTLVTIWKTKTFREPRRSRNGQAKRRNMNASECASHPTAAAANQPAMPAAASANQPAVPGIANGYAWTSAWVYP